jgi:proline iminopeptidase
VIHGVGPGSAYIAPDLEPLARDRVLLYYDQRGFGRSDLVTDSASLALERHVADLEALRRYFGFEQVSLLAHSWGGILAGAYGAYAASHPDRIERMLLVEPSVPAFEFLAGSAAREQEVNNRLGTATAARIANLPVTIADAEDPVGVCRAFFQDLGFPVFLRTPESARRSRGEFCAPGAAVRNILTVMKFSFAATVKDGWDIRPQLAIVVAPTLVVYGEEGALGAQPMEGWVRALPNAKLLGISDAQHYPHVDQPDRFFPAADAFLRGTWPANARSFDK